MSILISQTKNDKYTSINVLFNVSTKKCSHATEIIQLICRANQLTSFYMIG